MPSSVWEFLAHRRTDDTTWRFWCWRSSVWQHVPLPLPKRRPHRVWPNASPFKFYYLLCSLRPSGSCLVFFLVFSSLRSSSNNAVPMPDVTKLKPVLLNAGHTPYWQPTQQQYVTVWTRWPWMTLLTVTCICFGESCCLHHQSGKSAEREKRHTIKGINPENDDTKFLRNVCACLPNCTASHLGSRYAVVRSTVHNILRRTVACLHPILARK